jgi:hypothetical protein
MADFIYRSESAPDHVHIVIRVPRRLWDKYEGQHAHFGRAIHAIRESVVELLTIRAARNSIRDGGDPFFRE